MQQLKKIFRKPITIILLVLIADQALKIWVKTNMLIGQSYHILGHWFQILFIENNGMAFGLQFGGVYGKYFLTIFRIIAIIVIGYYVLRLPKKKAPIGLIIAGSLILAGAIGNTIDSVFYGLLFNDSFMQVASFLPAGGGYAGLFQGKVVDMLYFPLIHGQWPNWVPIFGGDHFAFFRPIFNISDSAVTVGILMLLIFNKRYFGKLKAAEDAEKAEASTEAPKTEQ